MSLTALTTAARQEVLLYRQAHIRTEYVTLLGYKLLEGKD